MISYKYKLYRTDKTKHLDKMLREAAFVWNHALALQKRYYQIYHKYIGIGRMKAHFVKHIDRCLLHSQTVQEILERLDGAYMRFFKHLAARPPKSRRQSTSLPSSLNREVSSWTETRFASTIPFSSATNRDRLSIFSSHFSLFRQTILCAARFIYTEGMASDGLPFIMSSILASIHVSIDGARRSFSFCKFISCSLPSSLL